MTHYEALLAKVDTLFSQIQERHPQSFHCQAGCHSCCKPKITVNALEAEWLRWQLSKLPENQKAALLANEKQNPFRGERCAFLQASGDCGIYELRPIVCRSHGAPLQFKEEEKIFRDVCPLNFSEQNIGELAPTDVMNLDTIHALLSLLLQQSKLGDQRTELKPSALLR